MPSFCQSKDGIFFSPFSALSKEPGTQEEKRLTNLSISEGLLSSSSSSEKSTSSSSQSSERLSRKASLKKNEKILQVKIYFMVITSINQLQCCQKLIENVLQPIEHDSLLCTIPLVELMKINQILDFEISMKLIVQEAREQKNKTSILELEETDSESTMKDIEDTLGGADVLNAASAVRKTQHKPRKPSRARGEAQQEAGRDFTDSAVAAVVRNQNVGVAAGGGSSAVPTAMHFRFMAELQQYEAVSATERMLAELEQIKRSALDSQRSLSEVQAEIRSQRQREEQERGQRELEALYAAKIKQLLDNQVGGKIFSQQEEKERSQQELPVQLEKLYAAKLKGIVSLDGPSTFGV
jgi:hypothetical protein